MASSYEDELFIWGVHPDGCVDVANYRGDVLTHVPRADAERLIAAMERGRRARELDQAEAERRRMLGLLDRLRGELTRGQP